jgi:NRPS condensation-like uncharacterized protein
MNRERSPMADQTLGAMSAVGEWHIGLVVAFDGALDEPRLEHALRLCVAATPPVNGRFVPGWGRAHWEWPVELPAGPLLKIESGGSAEPALHPFFLLLRRNNAVLCLKLTHFVSDAGGLKEFAYRLSETYRRLADDADWRPPASTHTRSLRQVADRYSFAGKWRVLRRSLQEPRDNPIGPFPLVPPGKLAPAEGRTYVVRHIEPPAFRALVDWTKPRGLTINDALIAGLLRGMTRVSPQNGERLHRIIGTVDLRRYLPDGGRVVANLSGWVYANFGRSLGADFEATATLVGREMRRLKTDTLGLSTGPTLWALNRATPLALQRRLYDKVMAWFGQRNAFAPSLTNMGPIDPTRLDFGAPVRRAYLIVPLIFPPVFGAGASGFRDSLTLTSGFCAAGVDPAMMNELFDAWVTELPH